MAPTASSARSVRKDALRNRALLLESADALIREYGMELSLNAVAHHAGVGVGTANRHFPDREALIGAMFAERVEQVVAILAEHLHGDDLPVILWTGGALNSYLGDVSPAAWRRYIQLLLNSYLTDDDPARKDLEQPALTIDEIDAAMSRFIPPATETPCNGATHG